MSLMGVWLCMIPYRGVAMLSVALLHFCTFYCTIGKSNNLSKKMTARFSRVVFEKLGLHTTLAMPVSFVTIT